MNVATVEARAVELTGTRLDCEDVSFAGSMIKCDMSGMKGHS